MIRSMSAFATACLIANFAFAQPMLVPPTPSENVGPAPSFPNAPSMQHEHQGSENHGSMNQSQQQSYPTPIQDHQAPSYNESAPSYESYSTPSYNSAPGYEYESSPTYSAPSYDYAPATPTYFIGQSHSTFGSVPMSSPGDYAHSYMGGASTAGVHARHPYYSYRRPWFTPGPVSQNVTIAW